MAIRWVRIALVLTLFGPATAAAQPGSLSAAVVDSEGAVIASAYILVHHDASGSGDQKSRQDITRTADTRGRVRIELLPGFYDACFMAPGFTPHCQKILVKAGETVARRIRLQIDPVVIKELGDKF